MAIDYSQLIPNNVDLSSDRRLQRALEHWQPRFLDWWKEMGPDGTSANEVYLRTAISASTPTAGRTSATSRCRTIAGASFWPSRDPNRVIGFGDHKGEPAWQDVPGEYRTTLRRMIVTQGDTEPASVEQQRLLGQTAPSLYDLRNLFQVNVEEGRHLWAMVYLLHALFRPRRPRGSGSAAGAALGRSPTTRASSAPSTSRRRTGSSFFMFTFFTDRDGKFQLASLAEVRLRSAGAHLPLHADRGSAPHVRGRDGRQPHHPAHLRADEGAQDRRRARRSA